LARKPERERSLGKPKRRWVNNIKIDLREIGLGQFRLDLYSLLQGAVEGSCEYDNETSGYAKFSEILKYISDYHLLKRDSAPWS
jgi:hypothetical protein